MDKLIYEEENLSEEFLDENASAATPNMSPHIDRNMCGSSFHFSSALTKAIKKEQLSGSKSACKKSPLKGSEFEMPQDFQSYVKMRSNQSTQRSSLKEDIKGLLQKAIRIRSSSYYDPASPYSGKVQGKQQVKRRTTKLITMKDIKAAVNNWP
ncbi:unnamed protein product [Moneuplotes crassus]|uniref:Uncharacterized protein n=1 Tax=Euplotes crassus TaxID=5936 RepID=A0AAD2CZN0_EUPCR|nr:unnamed protein product [Moneuplotes crassus]